HRRWFVRSFQPLKSNMVQSRHGRQGKSEKHGNASVLRHWHGRQGKSEKHGNASALGAKRQIPAFNEAQNTSWNSHSQTRAPVFWSLRLGDLLACLAEASRKGCLVLLVGVSQRLARVFPH